MADGTPQGRKKPYSESEISKCKCVRCGAPARFQWNACADGNVWRPLCERCDIMLNAVVLKFLGFDDWKQKLRNYCKKIAVRWRKMFEEV